MRNIHYKNYKKHPYGYWVRGSSLGRGESHRKCLVCLRNRREAGVVGAEGARAGLTELRDTEVKEEEHEGMTGLWL